jgi:integral membrane protein
MTAAGPEARPPEARPPEARPPGTPSLRGLVQRGTVGALVRYRVMAFIVGTALICLFIVVIFQLCGAKVKLAEEIVAPIHGYLYLVYLATAADLARRAHWKLGRILMVVAAGFVPTLAFIIEHRVYQQMQAEWAAEAVARPDAVGSAISSDPGRPPPGQPAGPPPGPPAGSPPGPPPGPPPGQP